jgi:cell division protein FtsN
VLTIGFALGVLVSGIFIFRDWRSDRAGPPLVQADGTAQPKPVVDAGIAAESEPVAPSKPKFEFYQVLQEREVKIPDEELRAEIEKPESVIEPNTRYWLQVGSFPKPEDAEGQKAGLALQGIKVQIAPVTIKGTTWHRVRTGPYADARALEEAKRQLAASNVEAFAYKEQVQ